MKIYFFIKFLKYFPHPWKVRSKFGHRDFWLLWRYNNFYHSANKEVIAWRKRQIQKHQEMLCRQDQTQRLLKDRDVACEDGVNPAGNEYPDLFYYDKQSIW